MWTNGNLVHAMAFIVPAAILCLTLQRSRLSALSREWYSSLWESLLDVRQSNKKYISFQHLRISPIIITWSFSSVYLNNNISATLKVVKHPHYLCIILVSPLLFTDSKPRAIRFLNYILTFKSETPCWNSHLALSLLLGC